MSHTAATSPERVALLRRISRSTRKITRLEEQLLQLRQERNGDIVAAHSLSPHLESLATAAEMTKVGITKIVQRSKETPK